MVKIGLIADIQYADRSDKARCLFRSSLDRLKRAAIGDDYAGPCRPIVPTCGNGPPRL